MKIVLVVSTIAALPACQDPSDPGQAQQAVLGDGGSAPVDGGVIDAFAPVDSPPAPPEPTIVPVLEFTCMPEGVAFEQPVAEVAGTGGDQLVIRQTSAACQYDLLYRPAAGSDVVLSASPAGYLLVAGADRVVCATPIEHHPAGAGLSTHVIDGAPLDCAVRSSAGVWQPMERIVEPAGAWAAWVSTVSRLDADTYVVEYMRDFSFQFANIGNLGRPPEDGVYLQTLEIVADDLVASGSPVLVTTNFTQPTMEDPTPGCPVGEIDPTNPACFEPDAGVDGGP